MPLSIAIACKDNESTIARTLDSIRPIAAEIVAADSGSTDRTIPLLESAGARIIRTPWLGYVKTKQLAIDHCTHPWILLLDSDESLEPDLRDSIAAALARDDPAIDAYEMNRKVFMGDRFLDHAWQPEWRLRLFRRARARCAGIDPHDRIELIDPAARAARLAGTLRHDSFRDWSDYLAKQIAHARTGARALHERGRRGSRLALLTSPPLAFFKQLILKRSILDGSVGWLAAAGSAIATAQKHMLLLELASMPQSGPPTPDRGQDQPQ